MDYISGLNVIVARAAIETAKIEKIGGWTIGRMADCIRSEKPVKATGKATGKATTKLSKKAIFLAIVKENPGITMTAATMIFKDKTGSIDKHFNLFHELEKKGLAWRGPITMGRGEYGLYLK